jgi:hypothetical protein
MNTYLKIDANGFAIQVSYSENSPEGNWIEDNDYPIMGRSGYKYKPLTKEWITDSDEELRNVEEIKVKATRLDLLAKSDWTQLPDNPLTVEKRAEWATYRQALRDITSQTGYPLNVIWPAQPDSSPTT